MSPRLKNSFSLLAFFLLFTVASHIEAQTKYHYVQTVGANFYQTGNWFCDFPATTPCVPPWLSGTTSFTIPSTDTVVIHGQCALIDVTTLTNNGVIEVVDGMFSMVEVSFFHHNGHMEIDEFSTGDNGDGGTYNLNNGSTLVLNGGMGISNFGKLNINTGSTLTVGPTGSLSYY